MIVTTPIHADVSQRRAQKDYPLRPIPLEDIQVTAGFWAKRLETNRTVTIPHNIDKCRETGRLSNFAKAARLEEGPFVGIFFNDSDVFKLIEGIAYSLQSRKDPNLEVFTEDLIDTIAAAQWENGYLYTFYSVPERQPEKCWSKLGAMHELYNAGHLYEAAIAYYEATGKRKLLDVAIKNADLVCSIFNPDGIKEAPDHQEIELALVKLYRAVGDEKYLQQAKFFLDVRGRKEGREKELQTQQQHKPVTEQHEAVGHAVRAAYMYCGMADIAALTDDKNYTEAVSRLWENIVAKKMAVTGGIGSRADLGEAFGSDYEIPNMRTYNETCASIANALFNYRLFLTYGDGKYMDVLERVIYNGFLAGVSMEGNEFFYTNLLESGGNRKRNSWYDCACCPPNVVRFIPLIQSFAYACSDKDLYINLFLASSAVVRMQNHTIKITQKTDYPWGETVRITVDPEIPMEFTVNVRIPGWARNEPVPSDLYRYINRTRTSATLMVNGHSRRIDLHNGFTGISQEWQKGDVIEVRFAMPVRRVKAHKKVDADVGKRAIERGPIVYCVEWPDVPNGKVMELLLSDKAELKFEYRDDLLGGLGVVVGKARAVVRNENGKPALGEEKAFTAIPYYAWANRGEGQMAVWLAVRLSAARLPVVSTIATGSKITVSKGFGAEALNDQLTPRSSNDYRNVFFQWWSRHGGTQWVQYDFEKPATVSTVKVYWFDDYPEGRCRVPQSWRVLYRKGEEWLPVVNRDAYGLTKDAYNAVSFDSVETDALRLEVEIPDGSTSGLHEWIVE